MKFSLLAAAALAVAVPGGTADAQDGPWATGYYAGWQLGRGDNGYLPLRSVDLSTLTDVILFSLVPQADGGLDTTSNTITSAGSAALLKAAHPHGTRVLISIGGWFSEPNFLAATTGPTLNTFVSNLTSFARRGGFDGIDIDWEPLNGADATNFTNLAAALRDWLRNNAPSMILTTTCIDGNQALMASVQQYFDRICIMTYDMAGNYVGWLSWYNSPLYNTQVRFPGSDSLLPSIDATVTRYLSAGVQPGKIGIGAEFGGTIWTGLTAAGQPLAQLTSISYDVPLYASDGSGIMQKYFSPSQYHWDQDAQVGYLTVAPSGGGPSAFISYDDSSSIQAKAAYIKEKGLGGIILYELGMGYPGNGTYPLLETVRSAFAKPPKPPNPPSGVPVPTNLELSQNYPNPFNPTTTITFTTPEQGYVSVQIFDELGRQVASLLDGNLEAGSHTLIWDATPFASGLYICRLWFNGAVRSMRMMHMK